METLNNQAIARPLPSHRSPLYRAITLALFPLTALLSTGLLRSPYSLSPLSSLSGYHARPFPSRRSPLCHVVYGYNTVSIKVLLYSTLKNSLYEKRHLSKQGVQLD